MSAPFKATATELAALGTFLHALNDASASTGVYLCAYGPTTIVMPDGTSTIEVGLKTNGEAGSDEWMREYVVDDLVGH